RPIRTSRRSGCDLAAAGDSAENRFESLRGCRNRSRSGKTRRQLSGRIPVDGGGLLVVVAAARRARAAAGGAAPGEGLDVEEDQDLGRGGDETGDGEVEGPALLVEDARVDPAGDNQRRTQLPVLDGLLQAGLGRVGDVDRGLDLSDLAPGRDDLGS